MVASARATSVDLSSSIFAVGWSDRRLKKALKKCVRVSGAADTSQASEPLSDDMGVDAGAIPFAKSLRYWKVTHLIPWMGALTRLAPTRTDDSGMRISRAVAYPTGQ